MIMTMTMNFDFAGDFSKVPKKDVCSDAQWEVLKCLEKAWKTGVRSLQYPAQGHDAAFTQAVTRIADLCGVPADATQRAYLEKVLFALLKVGFSSRTGDYKAIPQSAYKKVVLRGLYLMSKGEFTLANEVKDSKAGGGKKKSVTYNLITDSAESIAAMTGMDVAFCEQMKAAFAAYQAAKAC